MTQLLLVEDDRAVAMAVSYSLKKEGFEVIHGSSLAEARKLLQETVEVILLDLMLPDGDGYELCAEVRDSGNEVPIIFMTACDEESNVVMGLDLGADDYVTKPIKVRELISRIHAVLRRKGKILVKAGEVQRYRSRDILLDLGTHSMQKGNQDLGLTVNEFKLAKILMENAPNVLPRNTILEKLWDAEGNFIDGNALNVYMKRLREKVEEDSKAPIYILTVRGVGYKWGEEVKKEG